MIVISLQIIAVMKYVWAIERRRSLVNSEFDVTLTYYRMPEFI